MTDTRPNYLRMSDAEFKAHWDGLHAQLRRVNRRAWLYAAVFLACGLVVLDGTLLALGVPLLPMSWLYLIAGVGAAKLGRALAWRHEGGRPYELRRLAEA